MPDAATAAPRRTRATKKPLTKSKLGCRACKTRKVKCDERRPLCHNCEKRFPGVDCCEWDNIFYNRTSSGLALPSLTLTPSQSSNTASPSPAPSNQSLTSLSSIPILPALPVSAQTLSSRSLEFRLFYQWTSSTVHTIKAWIVEGPLLDWLNLTPLWASEYDFILEFILGFAALHLYCIDPVTNASYQPAIHYYIGNATQLHRQALANVTAGNAKQLFLAAMWTNLFGKARIQLREPGQPYKLPLEMFHLHRGLVATYNVIETFLPESEMALIRTIGSESLPFYHGADLNELGYLSQAQQDDIRQLLVHINNRVSKDEKEADILRRTLEFMVSIQFGQRVHEPDSWTQRRLSMMQAVIPAEFLTLLEAEDPLAMAILGRYFMLLNDRKEWFHAGLAKAQVEGITSMLPTAWKDLMTYPMKVVGAEDEAIVK